MRTPSSPEQRFESRTVACIAELGPLGQVGMACVYLKVGVGLDAFNTQLLAQAAQLIDESAVSQFVVGGDFNVGPLTLEALQLHVRMKAHIVAPSEPTCVTKKSKTIIDMAMVSLSLIGAVHKMGVVCDGFVSPHRPVQLQLKPLAWGRKVPRLCMPQRLPSVAPFGPKPRPLDWSPVLAALEKAREISHQTSSPSVRQSVLDAGYVIFGKHMEKEVAQVTGTELRKPGARLRTPRIEARALVPGGEKTIVAKAWESFTRPIRWLQTRTFILRQLLGDMISSKAVIGETEALSLSLLGFEEDHLEARPAQLDADEGLREEAELLLDILRGAQADWLKSGSTASFCTGPAYVAKYGRAIGCITRGPRATG